MSDTGQASSAFASCLSLQSNTRKVFQDCEWDEWEPKWRQPEELGGKGSHWQGFPVGGLCGATTQGSLPFAYALTYFILYYCRVPGASGR